MMTGFAANEITHGGMAEAMGLGHRHAFDYDGSHCGDVAYHETMHGDHSQMRTMNGSHADSNCAGVQMAGEGL